MAWPDPTHDSVKARISRWTHPRLSWCLRCGMSWGEVTAHDTRYNFHSSCFPLCEECWSELGIPEARIEYYKALVDQWNLVNPVKEDTEREIKQAVANGG